MKYKRTGSTGFGHIYTSRIFVCASNDALVAAIYLEPESSPPVLNEGNYIAYAFVTYCVQLI